MNAMQKVMTRNQALTNLQQGTLAKNGEVLAYSLYDTMVVAAATNTYDFFTIPQGQAGKTLGDTNQLSAGVMPAGQRLTAEFIKISVLGDTQDINSIDLDAIYRMLYTSTVEIQIPGKDNLGVWPLSELLGLHFAFAPILTQELAEPRFTGVFKLRVPIVLAAQSTFKVHLIHHAALTSYTDNLKIRFAFSGILERLS